jgi:Uma2 family endonuclease
MKVDVRAPDEVIYPSSDGKPMGENTLQIRWIISLFNGFEALFRDTPDVFVAADLFWYPVRGDATTATAPDLMIAFGRPRGERASYRQWDENGVAPQVVWEILSPGNRASEMRDKLRFYQRYGVEEYYVYDPDDFTLDIHTRQGRQLVLVDEPDGFVSPRLGTTFRAPGDEEMRVIRPDGRPFQTYLELLEHGRTQQTRAERERRRATKAERRADEEKARADEEKARAERLAERLRQLGEDPDSI